MIETMNLREMKISAPETRQAALRSELEATRAKFHVMLGAVGPTEWRQKSPACEWTVGEVFTHLTWALEYLPKEVEKARQGQGMFNMPGWLSDPLSYWYMRWIARTASPTALLQRYDRAMDATIRLLDTIPDNDWALGANFYGEGFHSVEDLFHVPTQHLREHTTGMKDAQ